MNIEIACSRMSRLRGLLGRKEFPGVLMLMPCNDIHTYGMRRAIDVAFVSSDGVVIESYRAIGARRRLRCKAAAATLERFADDAPWFECGDCIGVKMARRGLFLTRR